MKLDRIVLIISICFFLLSLTQDAYSTIDNSSYIKSTNSFFFLLIGWIGAILGEGGAAVCWLANPLIFIAWVFYRKNIKISLISALLSLIFSLSFLFFEKVIASEAPTFLKIIEYKLGYWFWVLSIIIFTIGTLVGFFKKNHIVRSKIDSHSSRILWIKPNKKDNKFHIVFLQKNHLYQALLKWNNFFHGLPPKSYFQFNKPKLSSYFLKFLGSKTMCIYIRLLSFNYGKNTM